MGGDGTVILTTYARVHDETVAKHYYTAMQWVEKRMEFSFAPQDEVQAVLPRRLMLVPEQMKEPELDTESRRELVEQFFGHWRLIQSLKWILVKLLCC